MSEQLLLSLRGLQSDLPEDVRGKCGGFAWSERVHAVAVEDQHITVRFYSDGLDLQAKIAVENFLRTAAQPLLPSAKELKVYMERRDKSATPPPRNNASTSAAGPAAA
ncbi:MAG: hypothetical protein RIR26_1613, partial [Pseudomonadota bacterium]